jgi:hypothetical protein
VTDETDRSRVSTIATVVLLAGSLTLLVGSFGTWLYSGGAGRSSFVLFDLVDRLGFAAGGGFATVIRWWPVMPLVVVAANVMAWWGRSVFAAVLAIVGGAYSLAMAIGVTRAPNISIIRLGWGVAVTAVGAMIVVATGVAIAAAVVVERVSRTRSSDR